MRFRQMAMLLAVSTTAWIASTGSASAAGPCDAIQQRGQAITQAQLAFTQQAYSDGQITPEEAAQAEVFSKAIQQVTLDLMQCIETGVVPPGYGPTEEEIEAGIRAACAKERDAIAELARLNQKLRDLVPLAEYAERLAGRTGIVATVASEGYTRIRLPGVGTLLKLESAILRVQALDAKYLVFTMKQDIARTDKQIAEDSARYNEDCKGYTVAARPAFAAWPAASIAGARTGSVARAPAADPQAAGVAALTRRLRRNAKQQRKSAKQLKAAMQKLDDLPAGQEAPAGDVTGVRDRAADAAELVAQHGRLRAALARHPALSRVVVQARDLPRRLRRDEYVRQFIGKPVSKLIGSKALAEAERRLIAVLGQQPVFP
jgi:hypothetical protein